MEYISFKELSKVADKDSIEQTIRHQDQPIVSVRFKVNGCAFEGQYDERSGGVYAIAMEEPVRFFASLAALEAHGTG